MKIDLSNLNTLKLSIKEISRVDVHQERSLRLQAQDMNHLGKNVSQAMMVFINYYLLTLQCFLNLKVPIRIRVSIAQQIKIFAARQLVRDKLGKCNKIKLIQLKNQNYLTLNQRSLQKQKKKRIKTSKNSQRKKQFSLQNPNQLLRIIKAQLLKWLNWAHISKIYCKQHLIVKV